MARVPRHDTLALRRARLEHGTNFIRVVASTDSEPHRERSTSPALTQLHQLTNCLGLHRAKLQLNYAQDSV